MAASVVLAGLALATACGSDGGGGALTPASPSQTQGIADAAPRAVAALCEARTFAAGGDIRRANDTFVDRAHDILHGLAAAAQGREPAAAAGLLEAMNRVESALGPAAGQPASGSAVAGLLDQMIAATRRAAASLGVAAPDCGG